MDLGSKICKDGKPIQNAEEIIENDEVLKLWLFYPWEQKHLIDEDGNFIENFIYEVWRWRQPLIRPIY